MKKSYAKWIILLWILLNVAYTIVTLGTFISTSGYEPSTLTICWFVLTNSGLITSAVIKVNELKLYKPDKEPSKFSKFMVAVVISLGVTYALACHYVTRLIGSCPETLTCCFYSFLLSELGSVTGIKNTKELVNSENVQRYKEVQNDYSVNSEESEVESSSSEDADETAILLCEAKQLNIGG